MRKPRHRQRMPPWAQIEAPARKIALVGNPNVGKSVFFAYLTGVYAEVSNYPGTTIEVYTGRFGNNLIIDTPGIYSVSSWNDEERTARDIILQADIVINIVNALHLERDLFLTLQLADMGIPMIVALNFMDEVKEQGIKIDIEKMSKLLGVPVIPTIATKHVGLDKVRLSIDKACVGKPDPFVQKQAGKLNCSQREAVLILEGDEVISSRHGLSPGLLREDIYLRRRARANDIADQVVSETGPSRRFAHVLGRLMLNPLTGIPILMVVLFIVYQLIGVLIAQKLVGFTEKTIMQGYWEPAIRKVISHVLPANSPAWIILVGRFGILTTGITYLVGLLLPLVVGFYIVLSFLEDTGYLPRLAALTDRLLNWIGLNGRAIIPIILGFGCITMATITTRLLGTTREKTIATSILNFTIPCSAQLGVIAMLAARIGLIHTLVYILVIGTCFITGGTILNHFLPGKSSPLIIDLPPVRLPKIENLLRKTWIRIVHFLLEAYPWFLIGSGLVGVLEATGLLKIWQRLLEPLTVAWLGLPKEAANAIVMGMIRRDLGAAGFASMTLTHEQTLVALILMTLFVPCVASMMILFKERGWGEAVAIWLGTFVASFLIGGLVASAVM